MSDSQDTMTALQAIRAKLQKLQMQQKQQTQPHQPENEFSHFKGSQVVGRSTCEDSDEFMVLEAAGNTGTEMETGPDAENISHCGDTTTGLLEFTHPASVSKQPHSLRHYSSTPEVRSSATKAPWSQVQISKLKGTLGKPMRIRNPIQQHAVRKLNQEKVEEDSDLVNFIKPFDSSATGRFTSMASSGYQSDMAFTTEDSLPRQATGSMHKNLSLSIGPSTTDSKVFSEHDESKLKGTLGKPVGVRNPVQQHAIHKLNQEKEEDSNVVNSIKRFNPSLHAATGRVASMASSGYHSDMTITTEDSLPRQATSSMHKNLSLSIGPSTADSKVFSEHGERTHSSVHSHHPPPAVATPMSQGVGPVMSTPSCQGPPVQPAVLHTPSGEMMEAVTVNGEQYCVLKKVGYGGSAQVYKVLDANKNIRALKVVDLEGAGSEVVNGFRNEIHLLQRLQYCDSVIKMFNFELNKTRNCLYVVLEFGETDLSGFFSARTKQKHGLDPLLIKFYWREMLQAVNALHKEGVIHSDLKPANFMLVAGNLKLIDFGIANTLQQDKTSVFKDSRVGTPSYMSPEAIMAACDDCDDDSGDEKENHTKPKYKVGVRSDVWSLGCILYNMVYGRTPFQHIKNNMGRLQAITNPSYTIKFPEIPDPLLLDLLQKCLTRDVKSRPTTTELLAHPYLVNSDKNSNECQTRPSKVARVQPSCDVPSADNPKPTESRRFQQLLKSHLDQGSPRTASAVNRVMNLLQEMEAGK